MLSPNMIITKALKIVVHTFTVIYKMLMHGKIECLHLGSGVNLGYQAPTSYFGFRTYTTT